MRKHFFRVHKFKLNLIVVLHFLDTFQQDLFVLGKTAGEFVPDYFGPTLGNKQGVRHFMRSYFVDTDEFTVLGEVFAVRPIAMSIGSVNERLTAVMQGE